MWIIISREQALTADLRTAMATYLGGTFLLFLFYYMDVLPCILFNTPPKPPSIMTGARQISHCEYDIFVTGAWAPNIFILNQTLSLWTIPLSRYPAIPLSHTHWMYLLLVIQLLTLRDRAYQLSIQYRKLVIRSIWVATLVLCLVDNEIEAP